MKTMAQPHRHLIRVGTASPLAVDNNIKNSNDIKYKSNNTK